MVRAAATDGNSEDPSHIFHKKHGDKLDFNLIPKETLADIFQFSLLFWSNPLSVLSCICMYLLDWSNFEYLSCNLR